MQTIYKPNKGDIAALKWIIDRVHVSASDDEIIDLVDERMNKAIKYGQVRFAAGERTRKAWHNAALKIHRKNQALYRRVMGSW